MVEKGSGESKQDSKSEADLSDVLSLAATAANELLKVRARINALLVILNDVVDGLDNVSRILTKLYNGVRSK